MCESCYFTCDFAHPLNNLELNGRFRGTHRFGTFPLGAGAWRDVFFNLLAKQGHIQGTEFLLLVLQKIFT